MIDDCLNRDTMQVADCTVESMHRCQRSMVSQGTITKANEKF